MGNHRFRLSDMLPNAWFYKLKDMGTKRAKTHKKKQLLPPITTTIKSPPPPPPQPPKPHHYIHHSRQSYHFPRDDSPPETFHNTLAPVHIPDPPRKSSKKRRSTSKRTPKKSSPRLVSTAVSTSAECSCSRASIESVWTKPDSITEEYPNSTTSSENESLSPEFGSDHGSLDNNMLPWSPLHTPCSCIKPQNDSVLNVKPFEKFENLDLPRIITKKTDPKLARKPPVNGSMQVKVVKEDKATVGISQKEQRMSPVRKNSASSPGMRLRTNSPRISTRKLQVSHRKSVSSRRTDSFAVVKTSKDPQRDFKESMVEMIMENNIKTSKDLEELLACYLSLNSDEYHHLIIKVFKQIWFDTIDIRLN